MYHAVKAKPAFQWLSHWMFVLLALPTLSTFVFIYKIISLNYLATALAPIVADIPRGEALGLQRKAGNS